MIVKTFNFPLFMDGNCYLVYDENSSEAVLVDCGRGINKINSYCAEHGLTVKYVLLTHGHFDHIYDGSEWQKQGAEIYVHEADEDKLYTQGSMGGRFGLKTGSRYFHADKLLKGGEKLDLAGVRFEVIHTPGHTPGGVCYLADNALFSGDTIFAGSYGRTDFPGGSIDALVSSAAKLFSIDNARNITVYPGHGPVSNLEYEVRNNPINYVIL